MTVTYVLCLRRCRCLDRGRLSSPQNRDHDEISKVSDHLGERGVTVVTKQGLEQLTSDRVFIDDCIDIPDMFNNGWNPTYLIELVDPVRNQPGRKQDQQDAGH